MLYLESIIVVVLLSFDFIAQSPHHSYYLAEVTVQGLCNCNFNPDNTGVQSLARSATGFMNGK